MMAHGGMGQPAQHDAGGDQSESVIIAITNHGDLSLIISAELRARAALDVVSINKKRRFIAPAVDT